jgi:hypothetical protein
MQYILIISDPFVPGASDGDIDDILAILFLKKNLRLIGFDLYVYIPYQLFENGKTRYDSISKLMCDDSINFITYNTKNLDTMVINAFSIGLMAPLSNFDEILLTSLNKRQINSFNFSQGETLNKLQKSIPDYNFLKSTVSQWLDESNCLNIELIKLLFPIQYKSSDTQKTISFKDLYVFLPESQKYFNIFNSYTLLKLCCVPSSDIIYAAGLFSPACGKANNIREILIILHENNYNDYMLTFEPNNKDSNYLENFIDNFISSYEYQQKEIAHISQWSEKYVNKYVNKYKQSYIKEKIINSLKIVLVFMNFIGFPFDNEFPKLSNYVEITTCHKIPTQYYYDLVASLYYTYDYLISDQNMISDQSIVNMFKIIDQKIP